MNLNVYVADDGVEVPSSALPLGESLPVSASPGSCSGPLTAASSTLPGDITSGLDPLVSGASVNRPVPTGPLAAGSCSGDWGQAVQRDIEVMPQGPIILTIFTIVIPFCLIIFLLSLLKGLCHHLYLII